MMPPVDINYVAVVVAAIANMVIGALWYSPALFANQWMKLVGMRKQDIKKEDANRGYIVAGVAALVASYVLAHFVDYAQATTIAEGMQTGLWVWVGFVATSFAVNSMFEKKPQQLYLITVGHVLVELVVMGAILAAWA